MNDIPFDFNTAPDSTTKLQDALAIYRNLAPEERALAKIWLARKKRKAPSFNIGLVCLSLSIGALSTSLVLISSEELPKAYSLTVTLLLGLVTLLSLCIFLRAARDPDRTIRMWEELFSSADLVTAQMLDRKTRERTMRRRRRLFSLHPRTITTKVAMERGDNTAA